MRELSLPADAGVERLLAPVLTVTTMGLQKVTTALCERCCSLAAIELHELREPFVAKMAQVWFAPVERLLFAITQVAFGYHSKRANGRKRTAVVAVQFVSMVAIDNDFSFRSARQLESVDKRVARIYLPFARIVRTNVFVAVAEAILLAIHRAYVYPRHLDIADVIVAIAISRIKIHGTTPSR